MQSWTTKTAGVKIEGNQLTLTDSFKSGTAITITAADGSGKNAKLTVTVK